MIPKVREKNQFPHTNQEAVSLLYIIEVSLRELVIENLSKHDGSKWFKTLLPNDIQQKYHRGLQIERSSSWTNHFEHHPIYYIDFTDLKKILNTNWNTIFKDLFNDKDVFLACLRSLEPVRNKLAHNRVLTKNDLTNIKSAFEKFETAIGQKKLDELLNKSRNNPQIPDKINSLQDEISTAIEDLDNLSSSSKNALDSWSALKNEWWFDKDYLLGIEENKLELAKAKVDALEVSLTKARKVYERMQKNFEAKETRSIDENLFKDIHDFYKLYEEYLDLPRLRGKGHKVEAWVNSTSIVVNAKKALSAIEKIQKEMTNYDREEN